MKKDFESISKLCSLFSIVGLAFALVSGFAYLFFKQPILDTIAVVFLTAMFLPFLLTQVTLTAGVTGPFLSAGEQAEFWTWFFYLVMFPFINMLIFTGANVLFEFIPEDHLVDGVLRKGYDNHLALLYIGALYLSMITVGLIWRVIIIVRNKKIIAA